MLSIILGAADFTAPDLHKGRKIRAFLHNFPRGAPIAFPIRAQTPLCGRDIALRAKQKAATRRSVTADYEFMAFFDFPLLSSHFWVRPRKDHRGVDLIGFGMASRTG